MSQPAFKKIKTQVRSQPQADQTARFSVGLLDGERIVTRHDKADAVIVITLRNESDDEYSISPAVVGKPEDIFNMLVKFPVTVRDIADGLGLTDKLNDELRKNLLDQLMTETNRTNQL